jgi:hypothetical protein
VVAVSIVSLKRGGEGIGTRQLPLESFWESLYQYSLLGRV